MSDINVFTPDGNITYRKKIFIDSNNKIFNKNSTIEYRFYSYDWNDLYYLLFCGKVREANSSDFERINNRIEKCGFLHVPNKKAKAFL